jgi:signal peptide peptidase SppA
VKGVLLNINSPGGETDNAFETAAVIAALEKPCYAVADTACYSGAYLLASQADKIFCAPTSGGVGSIGVWCSHMDYSEMLKQMGVKVTLISAGEGKTDGNPYEPLSASAREEIQGEIDRLYGEFVGAVSQGRKMAATEIVKLGARMKEGAKAAMAAGLADMPGDCMTAWAALVQDIEDQEEDDGQRDWPLMQGGRKTVASATQKEANMADTKTPPAEAKTPTPAEIDALVAEARKEGFDAAAQIADLCMIAGATSNLAQYIAEKKKPEEVRADLLAAKVAAEKGKELSTELMPGKDAEGAAEKSGAQMGKPKPWKEVLKSMGILRKENN